MSGPDLILVGGGLANSLIAWRLRQTRPEVRTLVLEGGETLGGNHTWALYDDDISALQHDWLEPLVAHRWPHYDVAFPRRTRRLRSGYRAVSSDRLHAVVSRALGEDGIRFGVEAADLSPRQVVLATGETITAAAVIDGRGYRPSSHLDIAFQKFFGQEVRLAAPHGLTGPVIMDATVPQTDGYRFFYLLPFSPDTLLIEDTYYADRGRLDIDALRAGIADYAGAKGWTISEVLREEQGVLPITLAGDIVSFWEDGPRHVPRSGMRAALFHPTTGYSMPCAIALADRIAAMDDLAAPALYEEIVTYSAALWRRQGIFRLLNRMLFDAGLPEERYRVLERHYGLSEALIGRFYAGDLLWRDKLRILVGKPPVPFLNAVKVLAGGKPLAHSA